MSRFISNLNDLQKVLKPYLVQALELTRDEIFEILSDKVVEYYEEPVFHNSPKDEPVYYSRTYKLLEELTGFPVEQNGNSLSFEVGWSTDYLNFQYAGNPQWKRNVPATGLDVLKYMNSGSHGGTIDGNHNYFDEALDEIDSKYGGVIELFKTNCKKVGIPIR